ncbi:MAG: NUMOD4 domain-containing protein [Cyclobacteriaceae bacterium]
MTKNSDEVWKDIEGFSSYEISNQGNIRSKTRKTLHTGSKVYMDIKGKLLKQRWNEISKCYFLDISDDQKRRRTVYPHKETAIAYVTNPDPSKLTRIIHKDNNPRNNSANNLKWATPSEHMKWQFEVGNKNNYDMWKTRKKRYKNGFKPDTVLPGRPKVTKSKK